MADVVNFTENSAQRYVRQAIALFESDPPDSDFQRGYLEALLVVQKEAFNPRARLPAPPKTGGE